MAESSPRCSITLLFASISVTRAPRSGTTTSPFLKIVEMARQVGAVDEIDVLAVQREALDAAVAAVGDRQDRRAGCAVSTMMPCGQSSLPASLPLPPKVRIYSPLLLY